MYIESLLPSPRNTYRHPTHTTSLPLIYFFTPRTIHPTHPTLHHTIPHHTTLHYKLLRQTKIRTPTMAHYSRHPSPAVPLYANALRTTSTRTLLPHATGLHSTECSWSIPPKLLPSIRTPALQIYSSGAKTATCYKTYNTSLPTVPHRRSTLPTTRSSTPTLSARSTHQTLL